MSTENVMETTEMTTIEEVVEETINEVNYAIANSEIENSTEENPSEERVDYVICEKCGCIIEEGGVEVYEANGNSRYICDKCYGEELDNQEIFYCDNCDCYYNWDAGEHDSVTHVCERCYANDFTRCDDCNAIVRTDEVYEVKNGYNTYIYVCEDCIDDYYTCSHCDCSVTESYSHSDDDFVVCHNCFSDYYYRCNNCEAIIHSDNVYWGDDDEPYCECCHDDGCGCDDDDDDEAIHEYSYKPSPEFYECAGENTSLFMGVELEVDRGRHNGEVAEEIIETMENKIYCKRDGSLDEGFEIVSHPCTLKYHTEKMEWNSIMKHLIDNSFRSHDTSTCGLHVHVSRGFFGDTNDEQDLHIAKLIMLIDKFWDKVVAFSRRRSDNLNRWASKNNIEVADDDMTEVIIDKIKKQKNGGRYKAINLTNLHTIEFRIFRGTLKHETFLATLQFVETLCHYAKQISLPEIWRVNFTDIFQNTEYTELRNYLESKGLIASSVYASDITSATVSNLTDTDLAAV